MLVQRDWGNREVRKNARLKYTIERFGLDKFRDEVESRLGYKLGEARPFKFTSMGDPIGWQQGPDKSGTSVSSSRTAVSRTRPSASARGSCLFVAAHWRRLSPPAARSPRTQVLID